MLTKTGERYIRSITGDAPRRAGHNFTNWRVCYVAPKEGQTFEPVCHIEADSAEHGSCRVFDVPDPDESQVAAARAACDALNSHLETGRGAAPVC